MIQTLAEHEQDARDWLADNIVMTTRDHADTLRTLLAALDTLRVELDAYANYCASQDPNWEGLPTEFLPPVPDLHREAS